MEDKDDLLALLPRSPIVSSANAQWTSLQIACCQQPAFIIPEYTPHTHGICINAGKAVRLEQKIAGQTSLLNSVPGDISIYPANTEQSFSWHQEAEFWLISLDTDLIARLGYELYRTEKLEIIPQLGSLFDPLIKEIAIALKTTLEQDGIGHELYGEAMANALGVHLLTHYSNRSCPIVERSQKLSQQQLNRVVDYIYHNLERKVTLAQLGNLVQLSEFHFGRLFKNTTGIAPHQFHLQCRLDKAKELLQQGIAIAQVAQKVGFSSQGHLNYHFKRKVGATPKQFLDR
ncbi:MAG: AraC family transcriptional regulator [Cyanobacteria bacterium J06623_7]